MPSSRARGVGACAVVVVIAPACVTTSTTEGSVENVSPLTRSTASAATSGAGPAADAAPVSILDGGKAGQLTSVPDASELEVAVEGGTSASHEVSHDLRGETNSAEGETETGAATRPVSASAQFIDSGTHPDAGVQMLSAVIDGERITFMRDVLAYNGRPPSMDIWGGMVEEASPWDSLRVVVVPPGVAMELGEHACGPGESSFIMLIGDDGVFDSTTVETTCTIVVESAGTRTGEVFSGTFAATVYTTDGAHSLHLEQGTFLGVVP